MTPESLNSICTKSHTHTQEGNNLSRGKTVNRNRPRVEPNVGTNRMELQNNCSQYVKDLVKKWTNLHEKNGGSSAVWWKLQNRAKWKCQKQNTISEIKNFSNWQISSLDRAVKTNSEFEAKPIEIIQTEKQKETKRVVAGERHRTEWAKGVKGYKLSVIKYYISHGDVMYSIIYIVNNSYNYR